MVLSSSAPDDAPGPAEGERVEPGVVCDRSWIEAILLELALVRGGLLVLVDGARPERLGDLVRALLPAHPALEVHTDVRCVDTVARGSVLVLAPRASDADWLNMQRPVFARRELKVILWCDAETSAALARKAVDFFDWISHRHDCPPGPVAHAVESLRCALAARAPGVVWTGGDLDVAFRVARPRRTLRRVSATMPYAEMVAAVIGAGPAWIAWTEIDGPFRLRRVRWALAEAGRRGRAILVEPAAPSPGWWAIHGRCMPLREARARLANAGAGAPGRLAALAGLEPESVDLAARLLEGGMEERALERAMCDASDAGAAVAEIAQENGLVGLEDVACDVAVSPALRAFGRDPRVTSLQVERIERIEKRIEHGELLDLVEIAWWTARARSAPSWRGGIHAIEVFLRTARRDKDTWESLSDAAIVAGDAEVALAWSARALALGAGPIAQTVLVKALERQGWTDEAERALRRVIAAGRADDFTVQRARYRLGAILARHGEYAEAETLLRDALHSDPKDPHVEDAFMAASLQGVAAIAIDRGEHVEAEALLERALAIEQRALGGEHPQCAAILQDLAHALSIQGKYANAEGRLREALALKIKAFGAEHPSVSSTLYGLAKLLGIQGRHAEAESLLRRALMILGRTVGTDHPSSTAATQALVDELENQGKYEHAERLLRSTLDSQQQALGLGHPDLCPTLERLAEILLATGRRPEALLHARRSLDIAAEHHLANEPRLRTLVERLSPSID